MSVHAWSDETVELIRQMYDTMIPKTIIEMDVSKVRKVKVYSRHPRGGLRE